MQVTYLRFLAELRAVFSANHAVLCGLLIMGNFTGPQLHVCGVRVSTSNWNPNDLGLFSLRHVKGVSRTPTQNHKHISTSRGKSCWIRPTVQYLNRWCTYGFGWVFCLPLLRVCLFVRLSICPSVTLTYRELRKTHVFWNRVRNGPSRSSNVVDFGTSRKRVCDFL